MGKIKEKIGIIGCGNMGRAILSGLLAKKIVQPSQVFVFDRYPEKLRDFKKGFRVCTASSNKELVESCGTVVLAFKPQDLESVAEEIKGSFRSGQIVLSILAGTPIAKLKRNFGAKPVFVRAMPNLPAQIGEGITTVASSDQRAIEKAKLILSGCGQVVALAEKHFDVVTAVSGSGPAYFFFMMEHLSEYARKNGIPLEMANLLAVATVHGAGRLAFIGRHDPKTLRASVTSKGGTTEAALKVLEQKKFSEIFKAALDAARRRSLELSRR